MIGLDKWRGSTDMQDATGTAVFSAGELKFELQMESFSKAQELGALIENAYRLGRKESLLQAKNSIQNTLDRLG